MGSKSIISNAYLEDIGDAIRQKRGTEETYYPSQMGDAIRGIEGIVPAGTQTITQNGTYDVTYYAEAVVDVSKSMDLVMSIPVEDVNSMTFSLESSILDAYESILVVPRIKLSSADWLYLDIVGANVYTDKLISQTYPRFTISKSMDKYEIIIRTKQPINNGTLAHRTKNIDGTPINFTYYSYVTTVTMRGSVDVYGSQFDPFIA